MPAPVTNAIAFGAKRPRRLDEVARAFGERKSVRHRPAWQAGQAGQLALLVVRGAESLPTPRTGPMMAAPQAPWSARDSSPLFRVGEACARGRTCLTVVRPSCRPSVAFAYGLALPAAKAVPRFARSPHSKAGCAREVQGLLALLQRALRSGAGGRECCPHHTSTLSPHGMKRGHATPSPCHRPTGEAGLQGE